MARRSPTSRLNSVDFPTFGRPTMATMGLTTSTPFTDGRFSARRREREAGLEDENDPNLD
jgi:hypothetical protein